MTSHIRVDLRRLVESRADYLCEYCLIHKDDTFLGCQVDHVISEKHDGPTNADNLAYACTFCNRAKGTDIGSIAPTTGELVRLFNPRTDRWTDHFQLEGVVIAPRTPIGEATARVLGVNEPERILERRVLHDIGRYPSAAAKERLAEGSS